MTKTGKKQLVRKYDRRKKYVSRYPESQKLSSVDVSRVRNKSAKLKFLTQFLNPSARGEFTRVKKGISSARASAAGAMATDKFYRGAGVVKAIARNLSVICNRTKSRKDFLVSLGFWLKDEEGKPHFVEVNRRFARRDDQATNPAECAEFLSYEVYGYLARELTTRGLVLSGSAAHISQLKGNQGRRRSRWKKDGFLWEGHDALDANIIKIEWRIDHQSFHQ